jgi:valyl-tRNA synthetase
MFGLEFTGDVPFRTVYLHGLVRAAGGQKMSKTKGNVQDPLDLIAEYGTDALRLSVIVGNSPGNDFTLTPSNLESRRDFVNKLWNVGRFVLANTTARQRSDALDPAVPRAEGEAHLAERWIASRLNATIRDTTRLLRDFNFGEAGRVVHDFIWDELADWYVEAFKVLARTKAADGALLAQVFDKVLRLLHPLAPFVTEELWQRLTTGIADRPLALILAPWPAPAAVRDDGALADWEDVVALVRAARGLRADYAIESARAVGATIVANSPERADFWRVHAELIGALPGTRLSPIEVAVASGDGLAELAARSIAAVAGGAELLIPAEGLFDPRTELGRTNQELEQTRSQVARLEKLLGPDSQFPHKAPAETVERERERLAEQHDRLALLERRRQTLARLDAA